MVKLLDSLTLDIEERLGGGWVHTKAIGYGEYSDIPLMYADRITPSFSLDDAINRIESQEPSDCNNLINAYTYGHYGEEAHRWYVVAYVTYERTDKRMSVLELEFAPVYPDMFPEGTALTLSNLRDTPSPDICNRILGDRGKLPPA